MTSNPGIAIQFLLLFWHAYRAPSPIQGIAAHSRAGRTPCAPNEEGQESQKATDRNGARTKERGFLRAVAQFRHPFFLCAMIAAEHGAAFLQAVPDDSNATVRAGRRKLVNGTFKTVERIGFIRNDYLKSFIVVVPTSITFRHTLLL